MNPTDSLPGGDPREIFVLEGESPGPTFVLCGGIHGNEPDGPRAAEEVLRLLRPRAAFVRGRVVAVRGNLGALARGVRFLEEDLNRMWRSGNVARIERLTPAERTAEQRELASLLAFLRREESLLRGGASLVCLDLHSTSGDGPPFAVYPDLDRHDGIGRALEVPVILGLEDAIEGSWIGYLSERGHIAVAVEGGRSDREATKQNLVSAALLALAAAQGIDDAPELELERHRARLRERVAGLPRHVEITHRERVREGDGFTMRPGFRHFQYVRRGEPLADARGRTIVAPDAGFLLMPRYQGQGNDGFFLARPIERP